MACLSHESVPNSLTRRFSAHRVYSARSRPALPQAAATHATHAMRSGTLLGLIAWQLVLAESVRRFGENPHSLSNIELLVPLMMSDTSEESDESDTSAAAERYDRARVDKDTPFSNIPSSAFVLDESPPAALKKHKRGQKHSRKQDLAYRPRSVYLESTESAESGELNERNEQVELGADIVRACSRLMRSPPGRQNELLLLLCSELQDAAPAPETHCACCQQSAAPRRVEPLMHARRELVSLGGDTRWVRNYLRSPRIRLQHRTPE